MGPIRPIIPNHAKAGTAVVEGNPVQQRNPTMSMPNFNDMMKQLKEAGEKMQDVQRQLEKLIAEGESGGGMVRAKVNGRQKLLELHIDPEIMDDPDMVQDLVVAAVNNALEASAQLAQNEISKAAGGMINPADLLKNLNLGK